uniref:Elongin-B n=1 Tax=Panthera leo TaxID=9689 RepID=A0A8C9D2F2_PANLE
MDVFLTISCHKTTIFMDAKESTTMFELKRTVEGILKQPPGEQQLYKDDQLLDDGKTLRECGFTSQTAGPQAPATVGLPFSSPPKLPDVMKPQDSGSSANKQVVHKCWQECGGKRTLVRVWHKCQLVQPLWKALWRFLKKLKTETPNDAESHF